MRINSYRVERRGSEKIPEDGIMKNCNNIKHKGKKIVLVLFLYTQFKKLLLFTDLFPPN